MTLYFWSSFFPILLAMFWSGGTGSLSRKERLWQFSLFCFILAAVTGALYRFEMIGWTRFGFDLQNLRHAHSHLMFFGWAVPLPFCIILKRMIGVHGNREGGSDHQSSFRIMRFSILGALVFGLLSWPFFLLYGYRPVPLGGADLPLSVICAGLVMLFWYGFTAGYIAVRRGISDGGSRVWTDMAILLLFVCSLGAWGVAALQAAGVDNPLWTRASTHFFLSGFTEGWVVLAILAILVHEIRIPDRAFALTPATLAGFVSLGALLTFPYGIPETVLPPLLLATARGGGILVSIGVILASGSLFRWMMQSRDPVISTLWLWPAGMLFAKGIMQLVASLLPSGFWLSDHTLRVFYLHLLLLGALTTVLIVWLHQQSQIRSAWVGPGIATILLLLASLLPLTPFFPAGWRGIWVLRLAAAVALLPAIALSLFWWQMRKGLESHDLLRRGEKVSEFETREAATASSGKATLPGKRGAKRTPGEA